ncbi:MAG: hypothetical protein ACT4P7_04410 [Gemmatimonadaceae bacterium]
MTTRRNIVCTIALVVAAADLPAQTATVPVRTLTTPEIELPQPFIRISGIRELSDGRAIVVDPGEKLVALVDFARLSLTKIGREGAGPGEYSNPSTVLAALGDTTIVGDLAGRLTKIAPSGTYAGDVSLPGQARTTGQARAMGALTGLASDALGRLYKQASELVPGEDVVRGQRIRLPSSDSIRAPERPIPRRGFPFRRWWCMQRAMAEASRRAGDQRDRTSRERHGLSHQMEGSRSSRRCRTRSRGSPREGSAPSDNQSRFNGCP